MIELTRAKILLWLEIEEEEFYIDKFRAKHEISSESNNLYKTFNDLCRERRLKRVGRGLYRQLKPIKPVQWQLADEKAYYDFKWPQGHGDGSAFGFEDLIAVSPGDQVVLGGVSNTGKSALALNILAENMDINPCILMGNEYTTMGEHPSPKFKRRLVAMEWVQWFNLTGQPKFILLPVKRDFEDYMEAGKMNIIDWIDFQGDWTTTGKTLSNIKDAAGGNGISVVCLQKKRGSELAMGSDLTEQYADVYFKIDPLGNWESRLTVGKVKEPKGRVAGRMWAFEIIKSGSTLTNIREIEKCRSCKGSGYIFDKKCDKCNAKGYIDKCKPDDLQF